ncbi:MAG: hypothetical protein CVU42_14145 [Chloroflexi bacterium HGW-Chloroflexi-4]|nr:MAG: hypothetical protein CVU42_14145 [Chloroflexi bacterium HGW-Chloroflexi-4]
MDHWINLLPILLLTAACIYVFLTNDWRRILIAYAIIYICAFAIVAQYWSFTFSLVKLITGLMSLVVMGISINRYYSIPLKKIKSELIFRLIALCLIFILVNFMVYRISNYLSISLEIVLAAMLLIGFGLFQLGITHESYKIFLAILVLFFGFELIFSANEVSLLVNGLLAVVTMLIALMGSFMIINEFETGEK